MKSKMRLLLCVVLTVTVFQSFRASAQDNSDPRTVIDKTLPKFSHIKIIDDTKKQSWYNMWGYPGIWIKQTEQSTANITYNNVCTPYLSTDVVGDTLFVKMDQSFLYPRVTTWNPAYGMIKAIEINVPRSYDLKSVFNSGTYQYNTTIINFNCKLLSITSSNSFRIQNCKIGKLIWEEYKGIPFLADRCEYSLVFKLSKIGTLSISESGLSQFTMGDNFGSTIKKYECRE